MSRATCRPCRSCHRLRPCRTTLLHIPLFLLLLLALPAPATGQEARPDTSDFLWLEEIEGERAREWVRGQNERTIEALTGLPVYDTLRREFREMIRWMGEDVPTPSVWGAYLYELRRDADHQRGLWRRTTPESFLVGTPEWEVVLDVDSLAAAEDEPWVFAGTECLAPEFLRCVVYLSRRGSDAVVVREFDAREKRFVEDGFELPEAKQGVEWRNENSLYVYSAADPAGATTSGYSRVVRVWQRGEPWPEASVLFEADASDNSVSVYNIVTPGRIVPVLLRRRSFFDWEYHLIREDEVLPLDLPPTRDLRLVGSQMVVHLTGDWTAGGTTHPAGALLAIDFESYLAGDRTFDVVLAPEPGVKIEQVRRTRDLLLVNLFRDVRGELHLFEHEDGAWSGRKIGLPKIGTAAIFGSDEFSNLFLFAHESFLMPPTLHAHRDDGVIVRVDSAPAAFDAAGLVEEQFWATSKDGTRVPYFLVGPEEAFLRGAGGDRGNGGWPTLLTAYGGFGHIRPASYAPPRGVGLLQRDVMVAVANIRGGGELGPAWHRAGQRENRQNAYDDFIAVAEDLIRRGVTSPDRLGMRGGSNSGLLVGAVITQRPDLFGAAHAAVPLFDMKRYTKLLAGPSWIAEYGDPDDPDDWAFLREYSPYHNLSAEADYPPFLITTRTHDDRVHPGHGRRMAARMQAMGHDDVLFHEAGTGGHSRTERFDDLAGHFALTMSFLLDRLGVVGD